MERKNFSGTIIVVLQIFVHRNDIYYGGGPDDNRIYRITQDDNTLVYNGIADWIYEEEIFNSNVVSKYIQFDRNRSTYYIIIICNNKKFLQGFVVVKIRAVFGFRKN